MDLIFLPTKEGKISQNKLMHQLIDGVEGEDENTKHSAEGRFASRIYNPGFEIVGARLSLTKLADAR